MKGIPGFKGDRLRQAREALGLTQTSLADILSITKQAVSNYECGADSPSPAVFDQLRIVLRQESQFFMKTSFTGDQSTKFYRSIASATKRVRLRAEVRHLWIRELMSYMSEFIAFPTASFPLCAKRDPQGITMEEIELLASDLREQWHLGRSPIPNLVNVAETNGAIVVRHDLDSGALDALSEWVIPENRPLIILNSGKNASVRSRLDLGHEIGHMVLHRHLSPEQIEDEQTFDLIEEQAFRFGSALLLPERGFLEDLYSVSLDALRSIKMKWKVSIAMMIERLKHLGIINSEQHRRLRINYSTRRWNREEPYESEIQVEHPTVFAKSIQLLVSRNLQTVEQIGANTGFSIPWIEQLLCVPPAATPEVGLKVLEFKRRA